MFLGCLIGVCIFIYILNYFYKRKTLIESLPPGPWAWPVLGNILQIDLKDARKTFIKWHKKYGAIFTVWMGSSPQLAIADYDLMNELFIKRGDEFVDRPDSYIIEFFMKGKYGIVNLSGDRLREQRRFTLHLLRNFGMGKKTMEDKVALETEKMIASLSETVSSSPSEIDVTPHFRIVITNVISAVLMGRNFASDDDPLLKEFIEHMADFEKVISVKFQLLEAMPWLRYVPLFGHFGNDELTRQRDWWAATVGDEIERHKRKNSKNGTDFSEEPSDFVDAYLKEIERRKRTGESLSYFDEWQLICTVMDLWQAGFETTVTTLSWAILIMIRFPHVQERVQKEIDSVVGRQRMPDMNDKNRLPYTNAVLHELQRFTSIAAFTFGRMAKKGTEVAGFVLPEDIPLLPCIMTVLMDERHFADPAEFKPERFLENENFRKVDQSIPFSLGKRSCIGEGLAKMELYLIFTALLQKFKFSCESELSLEPVMGILMKPHKYKCFVTFRH